MAEVELPNPEEMEEIKEKSFTRKVAMTTAIYAVILAITSLGGNNAMKEMLLAQQQASDQWAYYQAKVIREHLYRVEKMRLEAGLLERGQSVSDEVKKHYEELRKKMEAEEKRYNAEKKEIEAEARKLEHERDVNRDKDPYFDYAEVLLQIAIVMATVAILATSAPMYFFSIILACLGAILSLNGFLLLVRIPFLHG
ncbi:MAG: DUF4337 domain-containing protein [bacterium]